MSNAAAREWPKRQTTVTPYYFRHQVSADMKADGQLDSGEISAALGHLSDATKSTYGHANMCQERGVTPAWVKAARSEGEGEGGRQTEAVSRGGEMSEPKCASLAQQTRSHIDTARAAFHLNRKPQTMRAWACLGEWPDSADAYPWSLVLASQEA
jgi:hypothetical protein